MQIFLAALVKFTNLQDKYMIIQGTRYIERRNIDSTEISVIDFDL